MQAFQENSVLLGYQYDPTSALEVSALLPRGADKGHEVLVLEKVTTSYVQAYVTRVLYSPPCEGWSSPGYPGLLSTADNKLLLVIVTAYMLGAGPHGPTVDELSAGPCCPTDVPP